MNIINRIATYYQERKLKKTLFSSGLFNDKQLIIYAIVRQTNTVFNLLRAIDKKETKNQRILNLERANLIIYFANKLIDDNISTVDDKLLDWYLQLYKNVPDEDFNSFISLNISRVEQYDVVFDGLEHIDDDDDWDKIEDTTIYDVIDYNFESLFKLLYDDKFIDVVTYNFHYSDGEVPAETDILIKKLDGLIWFENRVATVLALKELVTPYLFNLKKILVTYIDSVK